MANFKDILDKVGITQLISSITEDEYRRGLYTETPDIYIDASVYQRDLDSRSVYSIWTEEKGYCEVPYSDSEMYLKSLKKKKCSIAFSPLIWGNICASKFIHVRNKVEEEEAKAFENWIKTQKEKNEENIIKAFESSFGVEFARNQKTKSGYSTQSFSNEMGDKNFFTTVISGKCKKIFDGAGFIPEDDFSIIRSFDKIVPLSNFVADQLSEKTYKGCLCIEQKENQLLIWVLNKVGDRCIPTTRKYLNIPGISTSNTLVNNINILLHELIQVKHYELPDRAVIILNGDKMKEGMFTEDDLRDVCMKAGYFSNPEKLMFLNERYPVLKGLKLMEEKLQG